MTASARRRKRAGYEPDVPRCQTCQHFRKARLKLRNSLPYHVPTQCDLGDFIVEPTGCCDFWCGRDGVALPIPAEQQDKAVQYLIDMRKRYQGLMADAAGDAEALAAFAPKLAAVQRAIGRVKSPTKPKAAA